MPVAGSSRPNRLLCWPVHHSEPSGATAGSCGPEFAVGTLHSRIATSRALALLPAGGAATATEYRSTAPTVTAALPTKNLLVFMAAPFSDVSLRFCRAFWPNAPAWIMLLDNALGAKLRNPACIVSQNFAVDALIMLAETWWRLIESGERLGESYGQSHGVNPVRRAVFWVNHGNCLVSGHHAGI